LFLGSFLEIFLDFLGVAVEFLDGIDEEGIKVVDDFVDAER
jgi:hypothetical protein